MARRPLVAAYATRFHGPGMEEGPDAVLAALPGPLDPVRVQPDDREVGRAAT